jgi:hypothetical protein
VQPFNPDLAVPLMLFVLIFGIVALKILAESLTKIVCHWRDVSLKMRMLDAGFSASEIERLTGAAGAPATESSKPVGKPMLAN